MSLRPGTRSDARKKSYKVGLDAEVGRRRREDTMVEIRKSKREDNLLKKRREGCPILPLTKPDDFISQHHNVLGTELESIPLMAEEVWSEDHVTQLKGMNQFRKLLSIESSLPIDDVIKAGVIPRFVQFLDRYDSPQLQFEAAWVLTNVASGTSEHTRVVINDGAALKFVQLLSSSYEELREQAVWALGNISGDSPRYRDLVIRLGALLPLLIQLNENSKLSMLKNGTWTLANFCRGKPPTPFEQLKPALPVLKQLLHVMDEEVLTNACWALSHLSEGTNDKIQAVIDAGVCPLLVQLLAHPSPAVVIPALRTVGNIVAGDDIQTQFMIDNQILQFLYKLLAENHIKSIKMEACWTISNITAGNKAQVQAVVDSNIVGHLVYQLQHGELVVKKEAAWAISNATFGGTHEHVRYIAAQGSIKPLCDLLSCHDPHTVLVCLDCLENILKVGEADREMGMNDGLNIYAQMIYDCEGFDQIENLQTRDNNDIYVKAVMIIEKYWSEEEEQIIPDFMEEGENQQQQQVFNFGNTLRHAVPPGGVQSF